MGYENLLELEAKRGKAAVDATDLVAWIDDNSFAGLFVTKYRAVTLQWADGKGLKDHGSILGWRGLGCTQECSRAAPGASPISFK